MDQASLEKTAKELVAPGKGILAADESTGTIKKRFDTIGVESTEENHRIYRQLLFKTEGIEEFISGVILFDETIRQATDEGVPFAKYLADRGIIPGIKVDKGAIAFPNFPNDKLTEGLDGLRERLSEYSSLGAEFTKWRMVVPIGEGIPSDVSLTTNAHSLARFAAYSQEAGLVPIVEPETLMDGDHDISRHFEVTKKVLNEVFKALKINKVDIRSILLKPNMVLSGKEAKVQAGSEEIAQRTLECLSDTVPTEVPGIVFLSGGQTPEQATANLNEINKLNNVSWELSFSFGRALQEPVLEAWKGKNKNVEVAQSAFYKRARLNSLARQGKYDVKMEKET
jgi:fructose-bisphosphate aldolase class I